MSMALHRIHKSGLHLGQVSDVLVRYLPSALYLVLTETPSRASPQCFAGVERSELRFNGSTGGAVSVSPVTRLVTGPTMPFGVLGTPRERLVRLLPVDMPDSVSKRFVDHCAGANGAHGRTGDRHWYADADGKDVDRVRTCE